MTKIENRKEPDPRPDFDLLKIGNTTSLAIDSGSGIEPKSEERPIKTPQRDQKEQTKAKIDKIKFKGSQNQTQKKRTGIRDRKVIGPVKDKKDISTIQRFDKAFGASLGLMALLSLLVFIPVLGPIMVLSLVPYIACNRGSKFVNRKNGIQVGLLVGIVWSIIEVILLFQILAQVNLSVAEPGIRSFEDMLIIVCIFFFNLLFCIVGGYTGGARFEKKVLALEKEDEEDEKH